MVDSTLLFASTTYRVQIVEKYSALLEVEHEEQIPIDADHSAMCCRFDLFLSQLDQSSSFDWALESFNSA